MKKSITMTMLLFFCAWFSAGCATKATDHFDTSAALTVDVPDGTCEPADIRDVFEGPVRMIPLETTKQSLIANIEKVLVSSSDSLYFLLDTRMGRCVQIFNADGSHRAAVRRIGRGPGEFDRPTDMALDESRRELHIYAQNSSKIIRNDYGGRFLNELRIKYYPNDFAIQNGRYLFSMFNQLVTLRRPRYNLFVTDFDMKRQDGYFVQERYKEKYGDGPAFNLWQGQAGSMLYIPPYTDKIFRIRSDGGISQAYDVRFGARAVPESFYREGFSEEKFFTERRNRSFYYDLNYVHENDRYLIADFTSGTAVCMFIYSKASHKVKVMAGLYSYPDTPVGLRPFALNDRDEVLWAVDARAFSRLKDYDGGDVDAAFLSFASGVKDTDNPVLVWYRIKPF